MPRNRPAGPQKKDTVTAAIKRYNARCVENKARREAAEAAELAAVISAIALNHLGLTHLETRNSDRLDFREHGCESIKAALEAAYAAGQKAGSK